MPITRRTFCASAALLAMPSALLRGQSARVDVAAAEREHTLAEADAAIRQPVKTLTSVTSPGKDSHEFYSESPSAATPFRAHADALGDASAVIAALTAAYVITHDDKYALRAGNYLYAWFADPATRMNPSLQSAYANASGALAVAPGLIDGVSLAEVARAIPFLADTAALSPPDLAAVKEWFKNFLDWMTTSRTALIARDMRDHTASAWLLVATCCARLVGDDATLNDCRHRFKQPTLRNQLQATGIFHHEVVTDAPYRNSLMNYDLLAAACEMLSTPFASLWTYELADGPGMRAVAAYLYPQIKTPARWPYPADSFRFREVPRRRAALLFAGRAYQRPEYVELWQSLPAVATDDPLRWSVPVRQPLLWVTRAPHENRI